jgi:spoIIIJ-associated protein
MTDAIKERHDEAPSSDTPNDTEADVDVWLEDFLMGVIERAGFKLWVEELETDDNATKIEIQLAGPDKARAIGRDGQVLDALQHVAVSAAANNGYTGRRIIIDIDHYRHRRDEWLQEEAQRLAEEAIETGEPRDLEPMPPRERRLVHLALADMEGITTESEGAGDDRYVRLVPTS